MKRNSGMALLAVMMALMVLSVVATTMAVSIQTEARIDGAEFEALQAQELARSGQEIASFLQTRGLVTNATFLAGLPFEVVTPGFHYRAGTTSGTIEIYFEDDSGRINPRTAPAEMLNNFFGLWTGDVAKGQIISESIADWCDSDEDTRANGAEASFYSNLNITPRNAPLGIADLPLVRGMTAVDFQLGLSRVHQGLAIRQSLDSFLTDASSNPTINVNFAPELVLRAIPGLTEAQVDRLMALRRDRPFQDMGAVQARAGLSPESPAWRYLSVSRIAPTVLTIARMNSSGVARSERRITYTFSAFNFTSGGYDTKSTLGRIEQNRFPDFL